MLSASCAGVVKGMAGKESSEPRILSFLADHLCTDGRRLVFTQAQSLTVTSDNITGFLNPIYITLIESYEYQYFYRPIKIYKKDGARDRYTEV